MDNAHESRMQELEKKVQLFMQEVEELETYVQAKVQKIRHAEAEIQKIKESLKNAAPLSSWRKQGQSSLTECLSKGLAILKKPIPFPKISLPKIHFPQIHRPQWNLRPLRNGLRHLTRAAVFSFLLFTIGFFIMNANAYSQITMAWLTQFSGASTESPLTKLVAQEEAPVQELFPVSNNKEDQKLQIPDLALAVTPPDNRLIIPKLNKNIPIIDTDPANLATADINTLEDAFQEDLKNGVIHFPGTANPGEPGNVFITGHSSYYLWDDGRYKDVFARLNKLAVGDDIVVYYNQQKYTYKVREKREVKKDDISILEQGDEKILTLMTCTPVGTNLRRLVIVAEQQTTHEAIAE